MSTRVAASDDAFAAIAAPLVADGTCTVRPMFGSPGLFVGERLAAFVSRGGILTVKLPPEVYRRTCDETAAEPMVMRGRPMREWLAVPLGAADWATLVGAAVGYVRD